MPEWLQFDDSTQTFVGTPPPEATGTFDIRVTAKEGFGNEASADFRLKLEDLSFEDSDTADKDGGKEGEDSVTGKPENGDEQAKIPGKPSLASQFKEHGIAAVENQRSEILQNLAKHVERSSS